MTLRQRRPKRLVCRHPFGIASTTGSFVAARDEIGRTQCGPFTDGRLAPWAFGARVAMR